MVKYQIFISSTFDDLKEERAQVIKAILEMGHIPVGMEMFSAADDEQWKIIARQIDETDYYVVVLGNRYGSLVGGISYTEKEYDYAVSKGVPALGFVIDPTVDPLAKNVETEDDKIAALKRFKNKVKSRPVGFWRTADELHGKVSIALMKAFNTSPRTGWSRAKDVAGPEVIQELSRLSKENSELRAQIKAIKNQEEIDRNTHLQSRIDTLRALPEALRLREQGKNVWDIKVATNSLKIFLHLGPEMMDEISVEKASSYLALMYMPEGLVPSTIAPVALNTMRSYFADFACLNLVEPSKKKHPVSDTSSYWSLTSEGMEVLKLHRVSRLEGRAARASRSDMQLDLEITSSSEVVEKE